MKTLKIFAFLFLGLLLLESCSKETPTKVESLQMDDLEIHLMVYKELAVVAAELGIEVPSEEELRKTLIAEQNLSRSNVEDCDCVWNFSTNSGLADWNGDNDLTTVDLNYITGGAGEYWLANRDANHRAYVNSSSPINAQNFAKVSLCDRRGYGNSINYTDILVARSTILGRCD